jgi:hypothetical protein
MKFPLANFILSSFVQGNFFIVFQYKRSYFPKSINQLVFERADSVFCAVGTENANNILTSFLLQKVKQKLVRRVDFIIAPPCIIYFSFHSKHFKDKTAYHFDWIGHHKTSGLLCTPSNNFSIMKC